MFSFSHSDKIPELAEGVNSLLSPKDSAVNHYDDDHNLIQKGKDILGDTLDKINENVQDFKYRVNKKSSGLLQKLSQLDNPIKRLKDKLLPEPKVTISNAPVATSALSPVTPQIFSIDNSAVFDDEFFTEHKFNFGKRNNKDTENLILVIPETFSDSGDDDNLPFLESTEYDDEDIGDEEDVIDSFAESKLGLDDIEDKEKMEKLEKKRQWAENFLKSYYKLQELKKKREEKEKKRLELESSLTTDDMKPFVNIQNVDAETEIDERKDFNDEGHQKFIHLGNSGDLFKTGPKHREMETKLAEFQTQKGLRIDDEEIQSIIDSQLQNFESFKIEKFVDVKEPEPEQDSDSELDKLRRQALKVYEKQMQRTFEDDEELLAAEDRVMEATTAAFIEDGESDNEEENVDSKIETATGNDILIDNLKRRRNKH